MIRESSIRGARLLDELNDIMLEWQDLLKPTPFVVQDAYHVPLPQPATPSLDRSRYTDQPRHLMAAVIHQTGVVVGPQAWDTKTNEITVARPLLEPLDLVGRVVPADAMHTQSTWAEY